MRLLLLEDVRKLGHIGDVVEVSAGYARNYLLPQRLATEPTDENIRAIEDRRKAAAAERAVRLKKFAALVEQLKADNVSVMISAAANPEGTLYGSVGTRDVAEALQAKGYPIAAEHVMLASPIRTLDARMVRLEFTDEIATEVKVWVVREGEVTHDDAGQPADSTPGSSPEPAASAE